MGKTIKVKASVRNGKTVKAHTRTIGGSTGNSDAEAVSSAANRAKALAEYKKLQKEMDDKENDPEEMKKQLAYLKKWRDGRRKMKAITDKSAQDEKDAEAKKKSEEIEKAKPKKPKAPKPVKFRGHRHIKELVKQITEQAAEQAKEFTGLKEK